MKELTIKEKAKAYDEAIKRSKNYYSTTDLASDIKLIGLIFPELKESEDEMIRKELIRAFKSLNTIKVWNGIERTDIIDWLEKQGEQKLYVNDNAKEMFIKALERVEEQNNKGYKLTDCDKNSWWEDFKAYTSCIIEQKPADNAEPKFHKGDWVVYCNDDVDLITGVEENGYCINNGGYIPFVCENEMRLWDITDAKVGDVLVSESTCGLGTWYCIFKSLDGDESMTVYCYLARDGRFETKKELCFDKDPYNTKPATKEQRNTLFVKMKDAGYTFDFDKKELKKIEGTTAWSEEDEEILNLIIARLHSHPNVEAEEYGKDYHWLKSLKGRVQPKKEWSEDDMEKISWILAALQNSTMRNSSLKKENEDAENWLKSLRPQNTWKPSDEQMDALHYVTNFDYGGHKATLVSLYEQLKKLM